MPRTGYPRGARWGRRHLARSTVAAVAFPIAGNLQLVTADERKQPIWAPHKAETVAIVWSCAQPAVLPDATAEAVGGTE